MGRIRDAYNEAILKERNYIGGSLTDYGEITLLRVGIDILIEAIERIDDKVGDK